MYAIRSYYVCLGILNIGSHLALFVTQYAHISAELIHLAGQGLNIGFQLIGVGTAGQQGGTQGDGSSYNFV